MKIFILSISTLILLAFACNTTKNKSTETTVPEKEDATTWNTQLHDIWVLTMINGKQLDKNSSRPLLELFPGDNKMGGNGGCNRLFGTLEAKAESIHFSGIGSTKMFCKEQMPMEREFTQTLAQVDRYLIRNLQLVLYKGKETAMIFQKVD